MNLDQLNATAERAGDLGSLAVLCDALLEVGDFGGTLLRGALRGEEIAGTFDVGREPVRLSLPYLVVERFHVVNRADVGDSSRIVRAVHGEVNRGTAPGSYGWSGGAHRGVRLNPSGSWRMAPQDREPIYAWAPSGVTTRVTFAATYRAVDQQMTQGPRTNAVAWRSRMRCDACEQEVDLGAGYKPQPEAIGATIDCPLCRRRVVITDMTVLAGLDARSVELFIETRAPARIGGGRFA